MSAFEKSYGLPKEEIKGPARVFERSIAVQTRTPTRPLTVMREASEVFVIPFLNVKNKVRKNAI